MRAMLKRAMEMGVGEAALDDVEKKSEVIALIMSHMDQQKKTDEAAKLAQLKEELSGMTLCALRPASAPGCWRSVDGCLAVMLAENVAGQSISCEDGSSKVR
jgi:hypothetical protein